MKQLWTALAFVWVSLVSISARSAEIQSYRLEVRPSDSAAGAIDVRMELVYLASISEHKRDGFKYVGRSRPTNISVVAADGTRLPYRESFEQRPQEWRIDFDLSEPTQVSQYEETRSVIVSFTQAVDWRRSWTHETAELVWPAQFRVAVRTVEYRVAGGLEAERLPCTALGDAYSCRPTQPMRLGLARDRGALSALVGTMVGLTASALILLLALKSRLAQWLETKGVLPPAPAPAYAPPPSLDPQVFRAPPPLPTPQELPPPVLPQSEVESWQRHVRSTIATAAAAPLLAASVITVFGAGIDPGACMCIAFVVGALASLWINSDGEPRVWPGIIVAGLVVIPVAAGLVGLVVGAVAGGFVLVVGKAIADAPPGTGGGSSSCSSSGGSSCGGGGGGCGGGGCGGGGCGG